MSLGTVYMLAETICDQFEKSPGRHSDKAMLIEFRKSIDYNREEGYRRSEMMIYAPTNYVQVWVRDCWNVIPLADMTDEDDAVPLPGKGYVRGSSEWTILSDHDSCWRDDGVRRYIYQNADELQGFGTLRLNSWYEIINPPREELKALKKKQRP